VEALTADNPDVMTASIHNVPLFPGTGYDDDPDRQVWNYPLEGAATGGAMLAAVDDALVRAAESGPDVVLLAAGADGHRDDPLSALRYDYEHFASTATRVAQFAARHCERRVLVGGAGGYQPLTHTPDLGGGAARPPRWAGLSRGEPRVRLPLMHARIEGADERSS